MGADDGRKTQGAAASLMNGFRVLECFTSDRRSLGVTEIAEMVDLHKSTVSRTLAGLAASSYVTRDPETGRYLLGLGVVRLAAPLLSNLDVRRAASDELERLVAETGETAALTVWSGTEAVVVDQVPGPQAVKHTATIGTRYPFFESSSVRVFLAGLPADTGVELVASGEVLTRRRRPSAAKIRAELDSIREHGHALNDGLTDEQEVGVSAPIRDFRDAVVGCITVAAPRTRATPAVATEFARSVISASAAATARLGGRPPPSS